MTVMTGDAVFSRDQRYRFSLSRTWGAGNDLVTFICLMPSGGDSTNHDGTSRQCAAIAKEWGMGGFRLVSLFARWLPDWRELQATNDPIGYLPPFDNDEFIFDACRQSKLTVCAWGSKGELHDRAANVLEIVRLARRVPYCLAQTDGHPWPVLYCDRDTAPRRYVGR